MTPWELCRPEDKASAQALMDILRVLGLTQAAVARHCGLHRSQVHRWAHGARVIPERYRATIDRLIDAYLHRGLSVPQLQAVCALYTHLHALVDQMEAKLQVYADEGVVLREIWRVQHAHAQHGAGGHDATD